MSAPMGVTVAVKKRMPRESSYTRHMTSSRIANVSKPIRVGAGIKRATSETEGASPV